MTPDVDCDVGTQQADGEERVLLREEQQEHIQHFIEQGVMPRG